MRDARPDFRRRRREGFLDRNTVRDFRNSYCDRFESPLNPKLTCNLASNSETTRYRLVETIFKYFDKNILHARREGTQRYNFIS